MTACKDGIALLLLPSETFTGKIIAVLDDLELPRIYDDKAPNEEGVWVELIVLCFFQEGAAVLDVELSRQNAAAKEISEIRERRGR
jgi:hypothetical protein